MFKRLRGGGHGENRTRDKGFADPCLTTWLRGLELHRTSIVQLEWLLRDRCTELEMLRV